MPPSNSGNRDPLARVVAFALWVALAGAIAAVVIMTWHPWVNPWTGVPR